MSKAKNDKYYNKITWREVECPRCKGKGSIENFIYSTYYVNTTAASTDGGISTIETCNVCNGDKRIIEKRKNSVSQHIVECPLCGGKGYLKILKTDYDY